MLYATLSVVVVASLMAAAQGTTLSFNPFTRTLSRNVTIDCTEEGQFCKDCQNPYECIDLFGSFLLQELGPCPPKESCMKGVCTEALNPTCDQGIVKYNHTCRQVGIFPHPFNRCKYLVCVADNGTVDAAPLTIDCPKNYGFDPKTARCNVILPNNTCPMLIEPCQSIGQRGVIPGNPGIYFICLSSNNNTLSPQMLLCGPNQEYNVTKKACQDSLPEQGIVGGKCAKQGTFYDPTNCFSYYVCSAANANPSRVTCLYKMYFDYKTNRCVDFTCANKP